MHSLTRHVCLVFCGAQDGKLPLHLAAGNKASDAVVATLLTAYPDAAKEKDEVRGQRLRWLSGVVV